MRRQRPAWAPASTSPSDPIPLLHAARSSSTRARTAAPRWRARKRACATSTATATPTHVASSADEQLTVARNRTGPDEPAEVGQAPARRAASTSTTGATATPTSQPQSRWVLAEVDGHRRARRRRRRPARLTDVRATYAGGVYDRARARVLRLRTVTERAARRRRRRRGLPRDRPQLQHRQLLHQGAARA